MVLADAGLPMIVWQWPLMVMLLVPLIAVEMRVVRRIMGSGWKRIAGWVTGANITSTLVGIPMAWGAMLILELTTTGGSGAWNSPGEAIVTMVCNAAWVDSLEHMPSWMFAGATLVMLVPYFLVSVVIEWGIMRLGWKDDTTGKLFKTVVLMNMASYAILAGLACIMAAF